ncbi:MAG: cell wall-active antibiotics response protein [Ignavibacteriaceae bacterium]|jgi:predicted membrane protein|nr:cell wall-active antibiotics response protein [Ignavibacteriaceae bacterium]
MPENSNKLDKRVLLGGILIFLGGLFLLNTMNILDFRFTHVVFSWPFIMLVIGLFVLVNTEKKFLGGILSGIGALFLVERIFPQIDYNGGIIIPILFIVLGTYIILKKRKQDSGSDFLTGTSKVNKDKIDDVSIFGGGTKIISSNNFQGGNITAIFGGSEINLINCQLAEGDNVLDVLCVFGGTTIILPKEWNVVINVTSVLGGFSNKAIRNPSIVIDQARTLHIKGLAMFGGGEVKTYL